MKKILSLIAITFCLSYAVSAQSNQNGVQTQSTVNVKSEVAEPIATEAVSSDTPATKAACAPGSSKSCCSSKKGKETSGNMSKSCCSDGHKKESHCSEKKTELSPDQENKTDKKSNSQ